MVSVLASQDRWRVNTYLVTAKTSGGSVLIDPASGDSELLSFLRSADKPVDFVLLTHGHFDHLASAAVVCNEYKIPCLIHREDYRLVRQASFYSVRFDGTKVTPPRNLITLDSPDSPVDDSWGVIKIIFTPGHTPGSCCFVIDNFVFTGDTIVREAVGRTDNPGANVDALSRSVENLLGQSPEDGIVLPGHGRPWAIKEAREWWAHHASTSRPRLEKFLQP